MKVYSGSSWGNVAPDTSAFIDKSILTGKGALISASGASTPSVLTVASTNGYVLSVNSATTTGLEWTSISSYTAPTIGTTVITSGTTVSTITAVTLSNATISGTTTASGTITTTGDIVMNGAFGPGSLTDEFALILMGGY